MRIGIIAVEDHVEGMILEIAGGMGHQAVVYDTLQVAVSQGDCGLVFVELRDAEQGVGALDGVGRSHHQEAGVPVVVLICQGAYTLWERVQECGVYDVLLSPPSKEEIVEEVKNVAEKRQPLQGAELLRFRERRRRELVGQSPAFRRCMEEVKLAAASDVNVLLLGETGTGKGLVARTIHAVSRRGGNGIVTVNCAAFAENLLASELFGHKKGSFTGADRDRSGWLEEVGGGTLFIDEVGDIDLQNQSKLLQVLDEGIFHRLGDTDDREFNGRVICATSLDVDGAVRDGRFRKDLLGRIDAFRIEMPPLRERKEDIPLLIRHFLEKHGDGMSLELSPTSEQLMYEYDYPMNVRQLDHFVSGAVARVQNGTLILPRHLPGEIVQRSSDDGGNESVDVIEVSRTLSYRDARTRVEKEVDRIFLPRLLEKHSGKVSPAATEAGVDRKTFQQRLERVRDSDPNQP